VSEIIDISVAITEDQVSISTSEVGITEINAIPNVIEVNIINATTINPLFYDLSEFTNTSPDPFVQVSDLADYVPEFRTITINGNTQDLSTNRVWNITSSTVWGGITGTLALQTDLQSALNAKEPTITAGTVSQYWRGDKTWQTFPTIPTVNPSALTKTDDTNVTLTLGGTPGTALLQGVSLTLGWTGTLADSRIASASVWNAKEPAIAAGTTADYWRGDKTWQPFPSLTGFVPYTGATTNVNLGEYELKAGQLTLDLTPTGTAAIGTTQWNDSIGSSQTTLKGGTVILKNGVDLVARVVNKVTPNATLTRANYTAVRVSGAQGQRLAVAYAQANNDNNSADTIGLVIETIPTNQEGFIMTVGQLDDVNTTGSLQGETWADGDVLYLSPTVAGRLTNIKPTGLTGHIVIMGYVEYAHAVHGKIYVKIMNGWELDELHNVYIDHTTLANKDLLQYNSTTSLWENESYSSAGIQSTITLTTTGTSGPATLVGSTLNIPQYGGGGGGGTIYKLTAQTLAVGSWTLSGSYYIYTFSNVNITVNTRVDFTPDNASYNEVTTCGMLPEVDVAAGSCTFYSLFPPQSNITGEITIFPTV